MLVRHLRDLVAGQPARRRRAGKPEAGQGEHHDAKGIGGFHTPSRKIGPQCVLAAVVRPYLDNLRAITQVIGPAASRADSAGSF
jgi:hypothetical protein